MRIFIGGTFYVMMNENRNNSVDSPEDPDNHPNSKNEGWELQNCFSSNIP